MTGLISETLKYAYLLALPRLNFQEVYGPFSVSVALMFWAFLLGMLLLSGAYVSAQSAKALQSRNTRDAASQIGR